jgi:hypothetical protein
MKKLLLISIFTMMLVTMFGQPNIYHPFPDSNSMWSDRVYAPFCNNTYECSINQYTIVGDTLINGKVYKKLTQSGYIISQNYQYTFYTGYAGAYRQEINQKKVYFFPPYGYPQVDTLLYDFNLNVGDPLPLTYIYPEDFCNSIVDTIDSVAVGNSYRKRFHISTQGTSPQQVWLIEGIGCTNGLFSGFCVGWEGWQYLTCFIQNDTISYPTPPNSDCSLITSIPISKKQTNSFSIFPNPVKDKFTIEFSKTLGNVELTIINVIGQEFINQRITENKTQIDVRNLPSGVFIVRLKSEKAVEIEKIIKQ